jgi:hypothetical protein
MSCRFVAEPNIGSANYRDLSVVDASACSALGYWAPMFRLPFWVYRKVSDLPTGRHHRHAI